MQMAKELMTQDAPAKAEGAGGSAADIVTGIHDGLTKLMGLFSKTPAIDEASKARLGSLIQEYESIVDELGQPQGQPKPEAPMAPGAASMEAGVNPNARPM